MVDLASSGAYAAVIATVHENAHQLSTEIADDFWDASLVDGGHGTVEQRAIAWATGRTESATEETP